MKRLAVLLAVLVASLSVAPIAVAQLGPTNVPAPLTTPDPSQQPAPTVKEDDGLSTLQLVLMFGGAVAIIAIIAWVIMRDARGAVPGGRGGSSSRGDSASGSKSGQAKNKSAREREREQAAKRRKAKAARDSRKHNRPR